MIQSKASILTLALLICTPGFANEKSAAPFAPGRIERSDKNLKVPIQLINSIQDIYLHSYRASFPADTKADVELTTAIPMKFLNLVVQLEKRDKTALEESTEYSFPRGGGVINLVEPVTREVGSFWMKVKATADDQPADDLKVYFVSHIRQRKVGDKFLGIGCKSYIELSSGMKKRLFSSGLRLNTKDQRYLSVIGGALIFVSVRQSDLYLGSVTFEDTRFPQLNCT